MTNTGFPIRSKVFKLSIIFISTLLITGLASSALVTNSEDWTEVAGGMQTAELQNQTPYFTQTQDGSAVINEVASGTEVSIIQSNQNAFLPNLENQFEVQGYDVDDVTTFDSQLDMVPDDQEDFILTSRSDPIASLPAISLGNSLDSWIIIMDEENEDDVADLIEDRDGEIRTVGSFSNNQEGIIEDLDVNEEFEGENNFELSVNVVERIEEEETVDSVLLTDGRGYERDVFTSNSPVLLTGGNFLSEEAENYIADNEDLGTVSVLGAELATVGEELTDVVDDERDLGVFLKFGQANPEGVEQEAVGITFFNLPGTTPELEVISAEYIPDQEQFLATFNNPSETGVYKTSSITVLNDGGNVESTFGDDEDEYIPPGSTSTITYSVDLGDDIGGYVAEFTTSYGSDVDNQNIFIESEEENVFEPPRTLDISVLDLDDQSSIEISDGYYEIDENELNVELNNTGDVDAYTRATVEDIPTGGVLETHSSDLTEIEAGESRELPIDMELTEDDIEEIDTVSIVADYGERENFMINSVEEEVEFRVVESEINYTLIVLIILIILALLYLTKEVKDQITDSQQ